jgi:predicted esterase
MGLKESLGMTAAFAVAICGCLVLPAAAQEFERAAIHEKVTCRADPAQSYSLYLPSAFDPERRWPVLFLFDPGARGPMGVEAFRAAAETFGWILVGSNNSRNGPLATSVIAAQAIWADVRERLPVDGRRVYASGFSGGARVASLFPRVVGERIAGLIGCGAGLAAGVEPGHLPAAAYFGLVGFKDFNYGEMKRLDQDLEGAPFAHRVFVFDGAHTWPPPAECARAVEWLEVTAMKLGLRPVDRALAQAALDKELGEADRFEAEGRPFWAVDRLEAAARLAEGLGLDAEAAGLADAAGRVERLKASKGYGRYLQAESKRDRRAAAFREEFGRAFGAVEDPDTGGLVAVPKVLRATGIAFLRKEARGADTLEDRALASRMLFDLCFAARARAADLFSGRDLNRAGAYFDIAIAACEEGLAMRTSLLYDRACVAAQAGDKAQALRHLAAAVDSGFSSLTLLETDTDLDPIRGEERFREILKKVKDGG